MGFIYPLEGGLEHEHFLLTAWPPSCPFCLPAGPSQMVEVFCKEPIEFSDGAIMLAGTFETSRTTRRYVLPDEEPSCSSGSTTSVGPASCRSSRRRPNREDRPAGRLQGGAASGA